VRERHVRLLRVDELSRRASLQRDDEEVHHCVLDEPAMQRRMLLERHQRHLPAGRPERCLRRGRRAVHELHGVDRRTDVHDERRRQQSMRLLRPDRLRIQPRVQGRRGTELQVVLSPDRSLLHRRQQRVL
jgi:hypothetical protein